jgi:hypothetical protein
MAGTGASFSEPLREITIGNGNCLASEMNVVLLLITVLTKRHGSMTKLLEGGKRTIYT